MSEDVHSKKITESTNMSSVTQRLAVFINANVSPNWQEWRDHKKMRLNSFVALSMNIQPTYFDNPKYESTLKEFRREYTRRCSLAKTDADELKLLRSHPSNGSDILGTYVRGDDFVRWAINKHLEIPQEMQDIWGSSEVQLPLNSEYEDDLNPRKQSTYEKIIGALLNLMLDKLPNSELTRSGYKNQAEIIRVIDDAFPTVQGIRDRNLEGIFAAVNRSFRPS